MLCTHDCRLPPPRNQRMGLIMDRREFLGTVAALAVPVAVPQRHVVIQTAPRLRLNGPGVVTSTRVGADGELRISVSLPVVIEHIEIHLVV